MGGGKPQGGEEEKGRILHKNRRTLPDTISQNEAAIKDRDLQNEDGRQLLGAASFSLQSRCTRAAQARPNLGVLPLVQLELPGHPIPNPDQNRLVPSVRLNNLSSSVVRPDSWGTVECKRREMLS